MEVAVSGGVAGACFWASVFPTDVVKSRIQVRENSVNSYCNNLFIINYVNVD